jgi:DHA2 family multidrug resistance protein
VAPAVSLGLGSLAAARLKFASGLFNMMRNLGGAFGIAICGAILNSRTNLHFEQLAEAMSSGLSAAPATLHELARSFAAASGDSVGARSAALGEFRGRVYLEASTMAYADAFVVVMVACAAAALLAPWLRRVRPPT